jgi:hypothetical protein
VIDRLARLRTLNQRWLYLATVLLLIVPFVVTVPMPPGGTSVATQGLYETIQSCPPDKVVLIDSSWDMGSRAENHAQLECVVRHLCRRRVRFVVISLGRPFGPEFAARVIEPIAAKAGYEYGRDWVNTGFVDTRGGMGVIIDGLCADFHQIRPKDRDGTPAEELPLLARLQTIDDVHMVYCVTYQPSPEWISFANGQYGTPVGFGCMSIMAPNYFTYIDSGQLCGMLVGNRGAAEYEALLGQRSTGSRMIGVASFGNCIIIAAALLGNLGAWAAMRARRKAR